MKKKILITFLFIIFLLYGCSNNKPTTILHTDNIVSDIKIRNYSFEEILLESQLIVEGKVIERRNGTNLNESISNDPLTKLDYIEYLFEIENTIYSDGLIGSKSSNTIYVYVEIYDDITNETYKSSNIDYKVGETYFIALNYNEYNNIIAKLTEENNALSEENTKLKQEMRNLNSSIENAKSKDKEITNVDLLRRISQLEKIVLGKEE